MANRSCCTKKDLHCFIGFYLARKWLELICTVYCSCEARCRLCGCFLDNPGSTHEPVSERKGTCTRALARIWFLPTSFNVPCMSVWGLPSPLVKPLVNMPLHTASGHVDRAQHGAAYSLLCNHHPDNMGQPLERHLP